MNLITINLPIDIYLEWLNCCCHCVLSCAILLFPERLMSYQSYYDNTLENNYYHDSNYNLYNILHLPYYQMSKGSYVTVDIIINKTKGFNFYITKQVANLQYCRRSSGKYHLVPHQLLWCYDQWLKVLYICVSVGLGSFFQRGEPYPREGPTPNNLQISKYPLNIFNDHNILADESSCRKISYNFVG